MVSQPTEDLHLDKLSEHNLQVLQTCASSRCLHSSQINVPLLNVVICYTVSITLPRYSNKYHLLDHNCETVKVIIKLIT